MLGGRKVTATLIGETMDGSVVKGCPQGGTLTHSCEECLKMNSQMDWLLHTGVCAILISRKFPNTVSQLLQEFLSMKQECCDKTQISIHPLKVQHWDQYLSNLG